MFKYKCKFIFYHIKNRQPVWILPRCHSLQTPSQGNSKARAQGNSHCSKGLEVPLIEKSGGNVLQNPPSVLP